MFDKETFRQKPDATVLTASELIRCLESQLYVKRSEQNRRTLLSSLIPFKRSNFDRQAVRVNVDACVRDSDRQYGLTKRNDVSVSPSALPRPAFLVPSTDKAIRKATKTKRTGCLTRPLTVYNNGRFVDLDAEAKSIVCSVFDLFSQLLT